MEIDITAKDFIDRLDALEKVQVSYGFDSLSLNAGFDICPQEQNCNICFYDEAHGQIGKIFAERGMLKFEGNFDESAKLFLEACMK